MRVSRMLELSGLVDAWWFTEEARERGRIVHLIAESVMRGQDCVVSGEYAGYLSALERGLKAIPFVPVVIEERLKMGDINGRPDAIGYFSQSSGSWPDWPAVVDIKSGLPLPSHRLQLSLYEYLANNTVRGRLPEAKCCLPWMRFGLYVNKDGKYKWVRYDDPTDWDTARAVVQLTRWRLQNGLIADTASGSQQPDDPEIPI